MTEPLPLPAYMFFTGAPLSRDSIGQQHALLEAMRRDPALAMAAYDYVDAAKWFLVPQGVLEGMPLLPFTCGLDAVAGAFGEICNVGAEVRVTNHVRVDRLPPGLEREMHRYLQGYERYPQSVTIGMANQALHNLEGNLTTRLQQHGITTPVQSIRELYDANERSHDYSGYQTVAGRITNVDAENALAAYITDVTAQAAANDPRFADLLRQYCDNIRGHGPSDGHGGYYPSSTDMDSARPLANALDGAIERELSRRGTPMPVTVMVPHVDNADSQLRRVNPGDVPLDQRAFIRALDISEHYRRHEVGYEPPAPPPLQVTTPLPEPSVLDYLPKLPWSR